jgi:hypothetical protein
MSAGKAIGRQHTCSEPRIAIGPSDTQNQQAVHVGDFSQAVHSLCTLALGTLRIRR